QLGDLAGEGAAELLAGEDPFQLALGGRGQVGAVGVHEDDVDALRVTGGGAQGDAAHGGGARGVETGHRQRRRLQVQHVDGARVEGADDGPLQGARGAGGVAGGDDGGALL